MTKENYRQMYGALHRKKRKAFSGRSILSGVPLIADLVKKTKPRSIIDYGCGKGIQYSELQVHQQWGGLKPWLYDIGVAEWDKKPNRKFDGVICTDVMEHIAACDVDEVLRDIFSFLPLRDDDGTSFAFFWISVRPARRKTLPDGRNVHLTVKPPEWWLSRIDQFSRDHLVIECHFENDDVLTKE